MSLYRKERRHRLGESRHYRGDPRCELVGTVFGNYTVIGFAGVQSGQACWHCTCICGKEKMFKQGTLVNRKCQVCTCVSINPTGSDSARWTGVGEISGCRLSRLKAGAKHNGLEYAVSPEYLWKLYQDQKGLCALSGVPIPFKKHKLSPHIASLDRIDSSIGYVEGNLQWVHTIVNFMKSDMKETEFVEWCDRISRTRFPRALLTSRKEVE